MGRFYLSCSLENKPWNFCLNCLQVIKFLGIGLAFSFLLFGLIIANAEAITESYLTHGPVFGGVGTDTANVFVRTSSAATVILKYGEDPDLTTYRLTEVFHTHTSSYFTAIISLEGLVPETRIYIDVLVDGVSQFAPPFPSFMTFPDTRNPRSFKFIILSDFGNQLYVTEEFLTFLSASQEDNPPPAFAFIGGDFDHRNPETRYEKRKMFRDLYNPDGLGLKDFVHSILYTMPIVHQWDDHDAGLDDIDKTYPDWDISYQVFTEYTPTYPLDGYSHGIWQTFHYAHVDFFVLDNRSQRDMATDPDDVSKSMLDGNDLGIRGQLSWLKDMLRYSQARWKIIFTSVVTNPYTKENDGWAAYQTEWHELRHFIETNEITGVVFISGDLHMGAIDNGIASGFPEMVVPRANFKPPPNKDCPSGPKGQWSEGIYNNVGGPCMGYGVVTVLTDPDRLLLEVKDEHGNTQVSYIVSPPLHCPPLFFEVGSTPNAVDHDWYPIIFNEVFQAPPVVVTAFQTYNGSDPASPRIYNVESGGFDIKVEEERSFDYETGHTNEVVGYVAFSEGVICNRDDIIIGETGTLKANQLDRDTWASVTLQNSYIQPVVLIQIVTFNGSNPAHVRLRNITSTSFDLLLEEWDYLDQWHVFETFAYIVMESGLHELLNGIKLEVNTIETNHEWNSASFDKSFISTPIVLTQCQTYNGRQSVVTRQRNIRPTGVQVRLQEEEGNDGAHFMETIGYIAIQP